MPSLSQLRHAARTRLAQRLDPKARSDFDPEFQALLARCLPYTMTSPERLHGLHEAVEYVVREDVPGDVVECGVWRGGSAMMAALVLERRGVQARHLWLYDTFTGMSEPSAADGAEAQARWLEARNGDHTDWCYAPLEDVRRNLLSTGVTEDRTHFVQGKVEETIPSQAPERIAVLRLDTDFYESTRHELEHLYPRLEVGGALILDDYGHWGGARRAVDEYFAALGSRPLLARLDYTGRVGIKRG